LTIFDYNAASGLVMLEIFEQNLKKLQIDECLNVIILLNKETFDRIWCTDEASNSENMLKAVK
jgi:hypothetical protein